MYNILIVEDEVIERSVIKYLIKQNSFDLHIYETDNGKDALDLLHNEPIDILMTDIRMPIMDGLKLTEKAKQLYPDIPIIFFSNYSDFSYVKKALKLHAANYIMKPIDPDEFKTTISNILSYIQEQESKRIRSQKQLHIIQNHILYKLINHTSMKYLRSLYPQIDFSFAYSVHRLILFQMERDYFHMLPAEDEAFFSYETLLPSGSHFINLNPAQNILLLTDSGRHDSWYENLADKLSDHILKKCQINCHIAVSRMIGSPDELSFAYEETERKLIENLFAGSHLPIAKDDSDNIPETADAILNQLRIDIQVKDSISLRSHIKLMIDTVKSDRGYSQLYFRFLCTSVLNILLDGFPEEKDKYFDDYAAIISRSVHIAPIETLLLRLTDQLITFFENEPITPLQTLRQVKQYIHNHYAEDLSLEILAKKVYLSPSYLSKLFIEHNGSGINKYIKKVRMEKAKDLLLNTPLSVKEISKRVGYSSDSYFCKSFFKDFEVTPDRFRNQNTITPERKEN